MSNTARIALVVLGVSVLTLVFFPLLFMGGMMGAMMGGGGMTWGMAGLVLLVLMAGTALLAVGVRR